MFPNKESFNEIENKVKDIVKDKNLDLIDFKILSRGHSWVVRSVVDHESGGVTVDECSSLNRIIFSVFENSNILGDDFVVEVNSPGLDRPLTEAKDFIRVKGNIILVWLRESLREKNYLEGELLNVNDDSIILKVKEEIFGIPFGIISKALQKIS